MRIVLIHGFDPRGTKVGGIETHVRQVLRRHPNDVRILMVGTDDSGELILGRMHRIIAEGREIDFVPVLHLRQDRQTSAASSLHQSITLRFAAALARYTPAIRRMVSSEIGSIEIERYEFAILCRAIGFPLVTINHNEGDPRRDKMDSILSRYWYVHYAAERLALSLSSRVFGVTPAIRARIGREFPKYAAKTEVLTVSVDTELFSAHPFETNDGVMRLLYAGRLDEFKNPPLMFRVAARLHSALNGAFEFHYCGAADPERFSEFDMIRTFTVRHGALSAGGVAQVMRRAHMGILVSHFEGMPCFLLELLASGRPVTGIRLPQFDQMVEQGLSGRLVDRAEDEAKTEDLVVKETLTQWDAIRANKIDPAKVHAKIEPWTVDNQLSRLFEAHRTIARRKGGRTKVSAASPQHGRTRGSA